MLIYKPTITTDAVEVDIDDYDGDNRNVGPITLPSVDSWVYLRFRTDEFGMLKEDSGKTAWIEAFSTIQDEEGLLFIPPDETDTGGDGDYYIPLFKTESNGEIGDKERPVVTHEGFQSHIYFQGPHIVKNQSGSGQNVFKEFNHTENAFLLRNIFGRYGIEDSKTDDDVILDLDIDNIGTASGSLVDLWKENGGENTDVPGQIRRVGNGASDAQVSIAVVGDAVIISGNGYDLDFKAEGQGGLGDTTLLSIDDGFIDSRTNIHVQAFDVCTGSGVVTKKFLLLP